MREALSLPSFLYIELLLSNVVSSADHWLVFNFKAWQSCPVNTGDTQKLLKYLATGKPSNDTLTNRLDVVVDTINDDTEKVSVMFTVQDEKEVYGALRAKEARNEKDQEWGRLVIELTEQGRTDDIVICAKDPEFRYKTLIELGIYKETEQ